MKQLSKVALLALGFGLVAMAFFSMHGRTVKAQSITGGSTVNTQITLWCSDYVYVTVASLYTCDNWQQTTSYGVSGTFSSIPATVTLIITDFECNTVGAAGEYGVCMLVQQFPPAYAPLEPFAEAGAIAGPYGTSVMGLHLTTGVPFVGPNYIPNIYVTGTPRYLTMHGYTIPMPLAG